MAPSTSMCVPFLNWLVEIKAPSLAARSSWPGAGLTAGGPAPDAIRGSLVGDVHQLEHLVVALDHFLLHVARSGGVVLLLGLRLQRAPLARHQHASELTGRHGRVAVERQDARLVEGLPRRVVLLPVGIAGLGVP